MHGGRPCGVDAAQTYDLPMPTAPPHIDLIAPAFYVDGARDAYAWMRSNSPVHRDEQNECWGIATYAGVREAEGNTAVFSNAGGSQPEAGPMPWMIDMDPPDHRKRRRLVSGAFTPARVRASADSIRATCDELIDAFSERGACDLRHDLAAPLPLIVICDMLGVPPGDRDAMLRWSDGLLGSLNGGADAIEAAATSFGEYAEYAQAMIEDRRANPTDDLVSVLVHDEVDGERLRDDEIMFEALLLLLGGDETTRNVTCTGVEAMLTHPAQWQLLHDDPDLLGGAVEEALRWSSPIKTMKRTVTRDVEFRGQQLHEGDRALLLFESANFDEAQFDEPDRFDVTRSPNDHIAFGFGAHFCLGAHLARLELQTVFERIVTRLPDLELTTDGPPPRSLTGISEMPVRFRPTPRSS
jgi:cytochrome P450 family 142 subfamily A polypeptide 1